MRRVLRGEGRVAVSDAGGPPRKRRYAAPITQPSRLLPRLTAFVTSLVLLLVAPALTAQPHSSAGAPSRASSTDGVSSVIARLDTLAFPHGKHAKLFPTCTGCHANVASGSLDDLFPPATACAECHNGTDVKPVVWQRPRRPAPQRLLAFTHGPHFAKTDAAGRACTACHAGNNSTTYMNIRPARVESCQTCHTHRATGHYAPDNKCSTCHVPLTAASGMTVADLSRLPKPATHHQANFASQHGSAGIAIAQCATCHARESCARCHVDARTQPLIGQLASDSRIAQLVRGKVAEYPVPDSHRKADFVETHGPQANAGAATCATCHARSSCATCHIGRAGAKTIARLASGSASTPGVQLVRLTGRREGLVRMRLAPVASRADTGRFLVRPHPADFVENHRFSAASSRQTCQGCHAQRFCSDCHAGDNRRAFHPLNFVSAHGADTYSRDRECASCHNTEVFCRDCHKAVGIAAQGRNAAVYHNAQPQWLLQHGRAARQELQTCTTCHTQNSCMRCHATTGWGVNPHGQDFDASRLGKKAMAMCARCHISDPRRR